MGVCLLSFLPGAQQMWDQTHVEPTMKKRLILKYNPRYGDVRKMYELKISICSSKVHMSFKESSQRLVWERVLLCSCLHLIIQSIPF